MGWLLCGVRAPLEAVSVRRTIWVVCNETQEARARARLVSTAALAQALITLAQ